MSHKLLDNLLKPLLPYSTQECVSEVIVNKPQEVWLESEKGWQCLSEPTLTMQRLKDLAKLIASFTNQSISEKIPLLSARLPEGARVQIIYPPAVEENCFGVAIRIAQSLDLSLDDFDKQGVFSYVSNKKPKVFQEDSELKTLWQKKEITQFLKTAVRHKKNILISGGTGSGKTTLLNTLLKYIPLDERIITIEDVAELKVPQKNHLNVFISRGGQSLTNLTATQLIEASLRLRPDRILMGELRGSEAFAFLRAINTGHPGALATIHADSPTLAIKQLALMVMQANLGLTIEQIEQTIHSVIDIIIQYKRLESGQRVVSEIYYKE